MDHRSLVEICRDIDAAQDRLTKLMDERAAALIARREGVIKAWDDGGSRQQIADAFGMTYEQVREILYRAGRTERQRRALDLTPAQRADYDRLLRQGIGSRIARQIAQSVHV